MKSRMRCSSGDGVVGPCQTWSVAFLTWSSDASSPPGGSANICSESGLDIEQAFGARIGAMHRTYVRRAHPLLLGRSGGHRRAGGSPQRRDGRRRPRDGARSPIARTWSSPVTRCGRSPRQVAGDGTLARVVDAIEAANGRRRGLARARHGAACPCAALTAQHRAGTVRAAQHLVATRSMRCPWCDADDDRVVDSRPAEAGGHPPAASVRRVQPQVHHVRADRGGRLDRGEARRLQGSVRPREGRCGHPQRARRPRRVTARGRPDGRSHPGPSAAQGPRRLVSPGRARRSLAALQKIDEVAYLRFASVYKDFQGAADFQRELVSLQKKVPAKRRAKA